MTCPPCPSESPADCREQRCGMEDEAHALPPLFAIVRAAEWLDGLPGARVHIVLPAGNCNKVRKIAAAAVADGFKVETDTHLSEHTGKTWQIQVARWTTCGVAVTVQSEREVEVAEPAKVSP